MSPSTGHKLIIETPELIPLEFMLAGVGSRFIAVTIDTLLQLGLSLIAVIPFLAMAGVSETLDMQGTWPMAILILVLFLLQYGYFAAFEIAWNGQTPGKRWLGLRVIRDSGLQITASDAVARNLLRIVDQLPGFYAIGILSTLFSPQSKRLGDYVAGTVVVHEAPFEDARPSLATRGEEAGGADETHRAAHLSSADLELIEAFLDRREQYDTPVRSDMARRLASWVASRMKDPPKDLSRPEEWLEGLARAGRRVGRFRSGERNPP